jgi:methylated-DNA-[protein]-cysteine S-methyltransferase
MSRAAESEIARVLSAPIADDARAAAERFAARAEREGLVEVAYATFDSPLGTGYVAGTERGIVSVGLPNRELDEFVAQISARVSPRVLEVPRRLDRALRELDEYFAGRRHEFDLELDRRLSPRGFYGKVLRETAKLPFGVTSTYGEVAAKAGNPRAYRAAGTALGINPLPIVVPCHRVLRAGGVLGNYGGGPEMKEWLLRFEGAVGE